VELIVTGDPPFTMELEDVVLPNQATTPTPAPGTISPGGALLSTLTAVTGSITAVTGSITGENYFEKIALESYGRMRKEEKND